jgi:hypothetical protein
VTDFGKEIAIAAEKVLNEVKRLTIKPWLTRGTQRAFENFHSIYW